MIRHQEIRVTGAWRSVPEVAGVWGQPEVAGAWQLPVQQSATWREAPTVPGVWRRIPGSVAVLPDPLFAAWGGDSVTWGGEPATWGVAA